MATVDLLEWAINPQYLVRTGIVNSNILKRYLALLTLGRNDFEAVEGFRSQLFDAMGSAWSKLAVRNNRAVLSTQERKAALRRSIKSVMQEMMYKDARIISETTA